MKIAVGSKNPAKLKAAKTVVNKIFPKEKIKVIAVEVDSGVSKQPKSDDEAIKGAVNRAKKALKISGADYAIGMEGGMHKIGSGWYECGWIAVVDKQGNIGLGSSARWKVPKKVIKLLIKGKELDEIYVPLGYKESAGVMSLITNGHLPRHIAYSHGTFFAFAPFISHPKFWD